MEKRKIERGRRLFTQGKDCSNMNGKIFVLELIAQISFASMLLCTYHELPTRKLSISHPSPHIRYLPLDLSNGPIQFPSNHRFLIIR